MLERDRILEIAASVVTVLFMLGALVWIGTTYGAESGLSSGGVELLIGAIVGFILLLTAVGVGLAYAVNPAPEDEESDDGADEATATP